MSRRIGLLAAVVAALAASARAQDQPTQDQPGQDRPAAQAKPDLDAPVADDQMASARLMAQAGIAMLPGQLAKQYNLTDDQREAAGQILREKWSAFGKDNQDKLLRTMILTQQLRRSGQAEAGDWQKLAKEGQPMLEAATKFMNESAEEFEKVLDDDQRAQFTENMMEMRAGQDMLLARARLIADGTVKLNAKGQPEGGEAGWPAEAQMVRTRGQVQVVEEEVEEVGLDGAVRKVLVKRVKSKLPDEESVAGDERLWPPYLKGFIAKYELTEEQQKLARRMLGEALKKASETRTKLKKQFEDARKKIAEAEKGDDANVVTAAHQAYDQLNRPVVAAFKDLRRQLDNLLIAEQREAGKTRGELFGDKTDPQNAKDAKDAVKAPPDKPADKPKPEDVKVHVIN
jgi:hypothetical protein